MNYNRQLHQITPGVTSYAAGNAWIPGPAPDVAGFSHGVRLGAKPAPPHRLILPPLGATTDNGNFHRFADFGYFGKPESYEKDLGLPRNRIGAGRIGSSWRHINQVLGNRGNQVLFIEGTVKQDDNIKYPWAKGDFGPLETGASVSYRPPRLFSGAQFSQPEIPVKYNYHTAIETEVNAAETIGAIYEFPPPEREVAHAPTQDRQLNTGVDVTMGPPQEVLPVYGDYLPSGPAPVDPEATPGTDLSHNHFPKTHMGL